jgi:hypothetical protein
MGYSNAERSTSQTMQGQQDRPIATAHFADNRISSGTQLQLQRMMNSSPQALAQCKIQASIHSSPVTQKQAIQCAEDEELLQGKFAAEPTTQLEEKPNNTGLPNQLKAGIESLSGMSMDHVKVHYNSDKPAQLNAHAYAQGSDIHVASGQEKHLPHEAWHVVQQAQGRVKPTMQMKAGVPVNDDAGLETEADVMGARAIGVRDVMHQPTITPVGSQAKAIQCYTYGTGTTRSVTVTGNNSKTKTFEECTYNSVEFIAGETKPSTGTATSTPAAWAGWLTNKKGGNNATQLHVVNKRWGGLGGQTDKNIAPGTPAENSHHLHEAEKEFDKCFNSANQAINNCKYECSVAPKYGTDVDVKGGNADYGDPTISVKITNAGVATSHSVTDGADGLTFKEGS